MSVLCLIRVPQFLWRYRGDTVENTQYLVNISKDPWYVFKVWKFLQVRSKRRRCHAMVGAFSKYCVLIHHSIKVTTEEPSLSVPDAISWWYYLNVPRAPDTVTNPARSHAPVNCETNPCKGPNGRHLHRQNRIITIIMSITISGWKMVTPITPPYNIRTATKMCPQPRNLDSFWPQKLEESMFCLLVDMHQELGH